MTERSENSLPTKQPMGLLDLPLDVLVLIFEEYMSESDATRRCGCLGKVGPKSQAEVLCHPWKLELVNSTLRRAFRQHLANRRWRMKIDGFDAVVHTDLPCPKFWGSTPPRRLDVRFHGFYNLSALPSAFRSLSTLCSSLRALGSLRYLRIDIDVAMPRPRKPFNVDLIELERAPLVVAILLQPFRTLHRILDVSIDVQAGSALRPLLRDVPVVSKLIAGIQKHLTRDDCPVKHSARDLAELERRLEAQEEFWKLWKDPTASCAKLGREFQENHNVIAWSG